MDELLRSKIVLSQPLNVLEEQMKEVPRKPLHTIYRGTQMQINRGTAT